MNIRTLVVVGGVILAGCAAIEVTPGAEKVIVSRQAAPKGCRFLGTLVGSQGGAFTGPWTSNKNLAQGAMNDIKNKAFALGGNYVSLEANTAGTTISGGQYGISGQQTDVTYTGNAYQCPPSEIGLQ